MAPKGDMARFYERRETAQAFPGLFFRVGDSSGRINGVYQVFAPSKGMHFRTDNQKMEKEEVEIRENTCRN
ncbi:conserved hypothetical protein, partial [delta proteobacterium NaphS2]